MPTRPLKAAGSRIEPPWSLPMARSTSPAASSAAQPDDEPPGVYSGFSGLSVVFRALV